MRDKLRHPFWQAAILIVLAYLLFKFGIAYLPGLIGVKSAPVPSSVVLQYMAGGTQWTEARITIRPMRWIAVGLLTAAAAGIGSWFFAHAFLTSHTLHLGVPLLGELHVPSALFFDVGVFALVVGATGLTLIALAHQSTRAHRGG